MSAAQTVRTNWAERFQAISRGEPDPGAPAAFGSDFSHPETQDLAPHPFQYQVPPGATKPPDYDIFGSDAASSAAMGGDFGQKGFDQGTVESMMAPAQSNFGADGRKKMARGQPMRGRGRSGFSGAPMNLISPQLTKTQKLPDILDDSTFGADGGAIPGWMLGILGLLGVWGLTEYAAHKGRQFARRA